MQLWITKEHAISLGMTHEGTLFGLPAWMNNDRGHIVGAVPKAYFMRWWPAMCDWLFDQASYFVPSHIELVSPIKTGQRIVP